MVIAGDLLWNLLFGVNHIVGPVDATALLQPYRADFLGPIVPTVYQFIATQPLVGASLRYVEGNLTENSSYLGLPLVVLLVTLVTLGRRNRVVLFSGVLAGVAFVLSLGSRLSINGRVTNVPLPEAWLARLPMFDGIVPVRFSMVVALMAVIAVTVGGDQYLRQRASLVAGSVRSRAGEMGVVGLMFLAVLFMLPISTIASAPTPWSAAAAKTVNTIPRGSVVLTYPFTLYPWTEAMSWQAIDGMRFRLIGGYVEAQVRPSHGGYYPPTLEPSAVQAFLVATQFGVNLASEPNYYYPLPKGAVNVQVAFCTFLTRYHVNDVLYWSAGSDPSRAESLFESALGSPTDASTDGTLLIWSTSATRCRP